VQAFADDASFLFSCCLLMGLDQKEVHSEVANAFFARPIGIVSVFGVIISKHHPCSSSMYSKLSWIAIKVRNDACAHICTHMCSHY